MRGGKEGTEKPNKVASTVFNALNFLSKDFRFELGGANLVSCPGRHPPLVRPGWSPGKKSLGRPWSS